MEEVGFITSLFDEVEAVEQKDWGSEMLHISPASSSTGQTLTLTDIHNAQRLGVHIRRHPLY